MQLATKIILGSLALFFLYVSNVKGESVESELRQIELSTDTWVLSLPESWKPEAIESGVRIDSEDEVFSIYVATYNSDSPLIGWAQRDIEIVKKSKYSNPENNFKFLNEELDLDGYIQSFVLDGYDKKSNFRIYTKHFRIGSKLVTLSIHDYWCQSYEKSVDFTAKILKDFKLKT